MHGVDMFVLWLTFWHADTSRPLLTVVQQKKCKLKGQNVLQVQCAQCMQSCAVCSVQSVHHYMLLFVQYAHSAQCAECKMHRLQSLRCAKCARLCPNAGQKWCLKQMCVVCVQIELLGLRPVGSPSPLGPPPPPKVMLDCRWILLQSKGLEFGVEYERDPGQGSTISSQGIGDGAFWAYGQMVVNRWSVLLHLATASEVCILFHMELATGVLQQTGVGRVTGTSALPAGRPVSITAHPSHGGGMRPFGLTLTCTCIRTVPQDPEISLESLSLGPTQLPTPDLSMMSAMLVKALKGQEEMTSAMLQKALVSQEGDFLPSKSKLASSSMEFVLDAQGVSLPSSEHGGLDSVSHDKVPSLPTQPFGITARTAKCILVLCGWSSRSQVC